MIKNFKKVKLVFPIALLLTIALSINVFADGRWLPQQIQNIKQEQTNWCWAASSVTKLATQINTTVTQTAFVTYVMGSAVNNGATDSQVTSGLSHFGLSTVTANGQMTYATVQTMIGQSKPVLVHWSWTAGGGHMVLISGYDNGVSNVTYLDPWYGVYYDTTYSNFATTAGGSHTWYSSIY